MVGFGYVYPKDANIRKAEIVQIGKVITLPSGKDLVTGWVLDSHGGDIPAFGFDIDETGNTVMLMGGWSSDELREIAERGT